MMRSSMDLGVWFSQRRRIGNGRLLLVLSEFLVLVGGELIWVVRCLGSGDCDLECSLGGASIISNGSKDESLDRYVDRDIY